jgi:hypothetical protein
MDETEALAEQSKWAHETFVKGYFLNMARVFEDHPDSET